MARNTIEYTTKDGRFLLVLLPDTSTYWLAELKEDFKGNKYWDNASECDIYLVLRELLELIEMYGER